MSIISNNAAFIFAQLSISSGKIAVHNIYALLCNTIDMLHITGDYSLTQCVGPDCPPCDSQQQGCEGQPDGPTAYPGRLLTEYYLVCARNKTTSIKTCRDDQLFDPIQGQCTKDLDPSKSLLYHISCYICQM